MTHEPVRLLVPRPLKWYILSTSQLSAQEQEQFWWLWVYKDRARSFKLIQKILLGVMPVMLLGTFFIGGFTNQVSKMGWVLMLEGLLWVFVVHYTGMAWRNNAWRLKKIIEQDPNLWGQIVAEAQTLQDAYQPGEPTDIVEIRMPDE